MSNFAQSAVQGVLDDVIAMFLFLLLHRWFLYPPSAALYSKQHPRLWYKMEYPTTDTKVCEDNGNNTITQFL